MTIQETLDKIGGNPFAQKQDTGISFADDNEMVEEGLIKMSKGDVRKNQAESEKKAKEQAQKESVKGQILTGPGAIIPKAIKPEDAMKESKDKTETVDNKITKEFIPQKGVQKYKVNGVEYDVTIDDQGRASFQSRVGDKKVKTFTNWDSAKKDLDLGNKIKDSTVQKVNINAPEEQNAIKKYQELKKSNPNLNIVQSISDYMKASGMDNSYDNRAKLAAELKIPNYRGTAEQNLKMYELVSKLTQEERNQPISM